MSINIPYLPPDDISRCTYCFTPVGEDIGEAEADISGWVVNFYNSIGIFFWEDDTIKIKHGAKYKWYDGEYPDEFYYKNKQYIIYDKGRQLEEGEDLDYGHRQYLGFLQINKKHLQELQDSRVFLEEFTGLNEMAGSVNYPDLESTEFTDLTQFDTESDRVKINKKHIQELRDSTDKLITFLNLVDPVSGGTPSYFNYTEDGQLIVRKDINGTEGLQSNYRTSNLDIWNGHVRNTHIEDLRHNMMGYWIEDWTEADYSISQLGSGINFSLSSNDVFPDIEDRLVETKRTVWGIGWNLRTTGSVGISFSNSAILSALMSLDGIQYSGNVSVDCGYNGGQTSGGATASVVFSIGTDLDPVLAINKNTKMYIEYFTAGHAVDEDESLGDSKYGDLVINLSIYRTADFGGGTTIPICAPGTGRSIEGYDYTVDGNYIVIDFSDKSEFWGAWLYAINISSGMSVLASFNTVLPPYDTSDSDAWDNTGTVGKIMIYPVSFVTRPAHLGNPTGYDGEFTEIEV